MKSLGRNNTNGTITLDDAQKKHLQLNFRQFKTKRKKTCCCRQKNKLYQRKQMLLNAFWSRILPIRNTKIDDPDDHDWY